MFIGEFIHNMDAKGRLNIPTKYRDELGESFYITKGLDNSLFVFTNDEWSKFEDKLSKLPLTNKNARAFVRIFYSGATECKLDKQGRILIPQSLREHARIDKETIVIGAGTRIEIWASEVWDSYNNPENISYDDIAEHMADLGI